MTSSEGDKSLVERLTTMYSHRGDGIPTQYVNPDGPEAAERILSLAAEVAMKDDALRIAAQAFRTLEEVAVAQLEHDKARNFIWLGDKCRAALQQPALTKGV